MGREPVGKVAFALFDLLEPFFKQGSNLAREQGQILLDVGAILGSGRSVEQSKHPTPASPRRLAERIERSEHGEQGCEVEQPLPDPKPTAEKKRRGGNEDGGRNGQAGGKE